jgi:hypothetical protein
VRLTVQYSHLLHNAGTALVAYAKALPEPRQPASWEGSRWEAEPAIWAALVRLSGQPEWEGTPHATFWGEPDAAGHRKLLWRPCFGEELGLRPLPLEKGPPRSGLRLHGRILGGVRAEYVAANEEGWPLQEVHLETEEETRARGAAGRPPLPPREEFRPKPIRCCSCGFVSPGTVVGWGRHICACCWWMRVPPERRVGRRVPEPDDHWSQDGFSHAWKLHPETGW